MVGNWSISMVLISGLFRCCTSLCFFSLLANTEMFHCAGAVRLDTARFFGVLAARFQLFCFINKCDARSLQCFSASCFHLRRQQPCLVCVGACITASSMMKIRKCLTLLSMRTRPCLVGLAAEINKTLKTYGKLSIQHSCFFTLNMVWLLCLFVTSSLEL